MKIKLLSYYISLIFLSFLFSACDGSSSGDSGDNSGKDKPEVITIDKKEEVTATINEAKEVVTQGASITLLCECGESTIRGQGETESKARESAQKKCTSLAESSSPSTISNCESPPNLT